MEERDPLKQLQSFISDRTKVLEKISSIQSTLQAIRSAGLATGESEAATTPPVEIESRPEAQGRPYDVLYMALRDMQAQIEERVRPLAEKALRAEEARLRDHCIREQKGLEQCVERIDQSILNCRERIDEYEERRAELARLNQRLAALGADPAPVPESLETENLAAIITDRFNKLRAEGRL